MAASAFEPLDLFALLPFDLLASSSAVMACAYAAAAAYH